MKAVRRASGDERDERAERRNVGEERGKRRGAGQGGRCTSRKEGKGGRGRGRGSVPVEIRPSLKRGREKTQELRSPGEGTDQRGRTRESKEEQEERRGKKRPATLERARHAPGRIVAFRSVSSHFSRSLSLCFRFPVSLFLSSPPLLCARRAHECSALMPLLTCQRCVCFPCLRPWLLWLPCLLLPFSCPCSFFLPSALLVLLCFR